MTGARQSPRAGRGGPGVTLVELLLALSIMLLIGAGVSRLLVSAWQSQQTVVSQNEAQRRAQQSIDAMVDTLRASSAIASGSVSQVAARFAAGNIITYSRQGGNLVSQDDATGQTSVVCRDVSSLVVQYKRRAGANWVDASSPAEAESLRLAVTVALDGYFATQTSVVQLRNKPPST